MAFNIDNDERCDAPSDFFIKVESVDDGSMIKMRAEELVEVLRLAAGQHDGSLARRVEALECALAGGGLFGSDAKLDGLRNRIQVLERERDAERERLALRKPSIWERIKAAFAR